MIKHLALGLINGFLFSEPFDFLLKVFLIHGISQGRFCPARGRCISITAISSAGIFAVITC
jgi:hypothetical protein